MKTHYDFDISVLLALAKVFDAQGREHQFYIGDSFILPSNLKIPL